jgi:hypothetical protein
MLPRVRTLLRACFSTTPSPLLPPRTLRVDRSALYKPYVADAFTSATQALWTYLDALHPHLWRGGKQFVQNAAATRQMMSDGELLLALTFNPNEAANEIAAKRMAEITVPQTVTLPIVKVVDKTDIKAELAPSNPSVQERFVPMDLVALQHPHGPRSRILPPDMLYDIIETHVREAMAAPAKAAEPSVAAELNAELNAEMTPEPAPAPQQSVAEAGVNAAGDADVDVAILSAPTSIPHAQMITQMAAEILPPTEPAPAPVTPAPEVESLSPVDVEKLLHDS